jgi:phage/plasmid-associated DNA primase
MDDLDTPESAYRKKIFNTPVDELPDILDNMKTEVIPECEGGFSGLLHYGLTLFEMEDKDNLVYEDFQKKYKKALHKVVVLYHKFADEGLLFDTEDKSHVGYMISFNKLFEIFYYWEQSIRSLWSVKKASHPLYDSSLNTDIGLFRFKAIDPDANNPYQNLILYLLSGLAQRGWRRQVDQCMERIYTKEGFDTHAWKPVMEIQTFVYSRTQRDVSYQHWFNITQNPANPKNVIKYLTDATDSHFIDVVKERELFSFKNGIYETKILNEETGLYEDRWYPHVIDRKLSDSGYTSKDICPKKSAANYFDNDFNNFAGVSDWRNYSTPYFKSVLDYQEFPPEVQDIMYVMCGRLLHEVGTDDWQVMAFLKGKAKSGKSTIIGNVCKKFFHSLDVGVLSNNIEKKFGLAALKDKFMFIAPEIKGDIGLEQCDFQTIISGETTSVAEKFKTASAKTWTTPGIMAGNEAPDYKDNQGSIKRRLIVFDFVKQVKNGDTQLGKKLNGELPMLVKKCNSAYIDALNKYGKKDIWNILPSYFKDTQNDMAEQTNSLINFLNSEFIEFGANYYCRHKIFMNVYNDYVKEYALRKCKWSRDFYEGVFEDNNLILTKTESRTDPMDSEKYKCVWIEGCRLITPNGDVDNLED